MEVQYEIYPYRARASGVSSDERNKREEGFSIFIQSSAFMVGLYIFSSLFIHSIFFCFAFDLLAATCRLIVIILNNSLLRLLAVLANCDTY